jgi:hypothetical protein
LCVRLRYDLPTSTPMRATLRRRRRPRRAVPTIPRPAAMNLPPGRARGRGHLQKGDLLGRTASSGRRDCRRRDLAAGFVVGRQFSPMLARKEAEIRERPGSDPGARARWGGCVRIHHNFPSRLNCIINWPDQTDRINHSGSTR